MGILLDSRYAFEHGLLAAADFERIHRTLAALGLPLLARPAAGPGPRRRPARPCWTAWRTSASTWAAS